MPEAVQWVLVAGTALSVAGLGATLVVRWWRNRVLGTLIWRRPPRRAVRFAVAPLFLLALGFSFAQAPEIRAWAVILLTCALTTWLLSPSSEDTFCGSEGLACGWSGVRFGELREWRLMGDHLRFRTGEEWRAVELPRQEQAVVRARLEALCPERESSYSRPTE